MIKNKKKYLFIGFGSIAQKHYKIIKKIDKYSKIYIYNKNKVTSNKISNTIFIRELSNTLIEQIDYVFILSPSNTHKYYLDFFLQFKKIKIFIEKPLSSTYTDREFINKKYSKNINRIFIGYNMRFMDTIYFIKKFIKNKKILNVTVNNINNLKYWRKKIYTKSVTSNKKLGGGIILELSHEFDYLFYLFENLNLLYKKFNKLSNLKINVEDHVSVIFKCKDFDINLNMNMFSYFKERSIKIFLNNETLVCDLNRGNIKIFHKDYKIKKKYKFEYDLKTSYERQFCNFRFNKYIKYNRCKINEGIKVLKLLNKIKILV